MPPTSLTVLPRQEGEVSAACSAGFAYAKPPALYRIFGRCGTNLTSSRPINSNRPRAQVAELVDALASGASGLTAVKVRVLSWAPPAGGSARLAKAGRSGAGFRSGPGHARLAPTAQP